jgi:hypothetical protein
MKCLDQQNVSEHCDMVISTYTSYLGDRGFKYQPENSYLTSFHRFSLYFQANSGIRNITQQMLHIFQTCIIS